MGLILIMHTDVCCMCMFIPKIRRTPARHAGETTKLGEPKPEGRSRSGGGKGSEQSSEGKESNSSSNSSDPRSESPMPDRTGYYATTGALVGCVLGWASQFF